MPRPSPLKHIPPKKQEGQGQVFRTINGAVLDVRTGSLFLGWSAKKTYGMVDRRLIPYRRSGGRIVFIKAELEAWLAGLPGVTLAEAVENRSMRYAGNRLDEGVKP